MNIIGFFDSLDRDLRYALRGLSRRPAFTTAAVLTLALGIGATTAIFSVVYSVLIKPLPYPNADELVRIRHSVSGELGGADFEPTMYFTYRDENRTFATIGLWQENSATLTDRGEPERVSTLRVTDGTLRRSACSRCADVGSRPRSTGPRWKDPHRLFSLMGSGSGDLAATKRPSGVRSRSIRSRRKSSASCRPTSGSRSI
jgi:hypothetical protein